MNILDWLMAGVPLEDLLAPTGGTYNVSATAPRILLNDSTVLAALQSDRTNLTTAYTRFRDMVDAEVAYEAAHASDYTTGTLAEKVAAGYGNIYHFSEARPPATNVTYWNYQQWYSALMYRLTGTTNYAQRAHDRIMEFITADEYLISVATSEGPTASTSALTRPRVARDSYLEIGQILGDIFMVLDWTSDVAGLWTTDDKNRICALANQALSNLWGDCTQATWGGVLRPWNGWSATAPSQPGNNYYSSFLKATLLTGLGSYGHQSAQAQLWIDKGRTERAAGEMVTYYNANLANGGSQEGTGYGIAHRDWYNVCGIWKASTGESLHALTTHAQNSGYWLAHSMYPGGGYIVNIGDHARDKSGALYDYHLMYADAGGKLYPTNPGYRAAKYIITTIGGLTQAVESHNRWSDLLMKSSEFTAQNPQGVLNTAYYNASTGYLATRTSWASTATLVTMMAGPYTESHAHQDQGSVMIIRGNNALFDDANQRSNSGIVPHVAAHNMVGFYDSASGAAENSKWVSQSSAGAETQLLALADNASFTYAVANTLPAYNGSAKVTKSQRETLFLKPGCVVLFDRAAANASSVSRVFNLNTSANPTITGDRISITKGGDTADCWRIAPTGQAWASVSLTAGEWLAGSTWNPASYRVHCVDGTGTESLFLHVMSVNTDVASVAANNAAGQTGVDITFTDGRVATVRFNNATTGGALEYRQSAGGTVIYNDTLPTTVTVPALLV